MNPQVVVEYIAKTTGLQAGAQGVENANKGVASSLKKVAVGVGAAYATAKIVQFGKASVDAATESAKVTAKLEQVFRSMGDTTGKAAKDAEAYASALSVKIGVDDEAIMSAQTLLATFKEVSGEVGRGAGIFDRATAAAADLSAAGFGDMSTTAKQLGKALNDPVKGINAMARSGVTFTEQEKEKIKTLVESNRITDAQRVVLAAVEKQVKGTAEAGATSQEKMAVAYGETQEAIGRGLLPILQDLTPVLLTVAKFVEKNSDLVLVLGAAMVAAAITVKALGIAQLFLNSAMSANVFGLIVLGVAAVVAAAVLLIKNWDKVTAAFEAGWDAIKGGGQAAFNWIKTNWPLLVAILTGPIGIVTLAIVKNWDKIEEGARGMVAAVKGAIGGMVTFLEGIVDKVRAVATTIANAIKAPINAVIRAWNDFRIPKVSIPSVKILGKKIGGGSVGGQSFPHIPELARGGVVSTPTLAMIGEGTGREIVTPESLLREIVGGQSPEVRVFIGDVELRGLVRAEIVDEQTGIARTLLAGAR